MQKLQRIKNKMTLTLRERAMNIVNLENLGKCSKKNIFQLANRCLLFYYAIRVLED